MANYYFCTTKRHYGSSARVPGGIRKSSGQRFYTQLGFFFSFYFLPVCFLPGSIYVWQLRKVIHWKIQPTDVWGNGTRELTERAGLQIISEKILLGILHFLYLQPQRTNNKSSFRSGSSSFGRARPCQGRGGRFEPGLPLIKSKPCVWIFFYRIPWWRNW